MSSQEMPQLKRFFPWLHDKDRDCSWESPVDSDGVQVSSDLDARGMELPDPTPMAPPVGMSSGPSLADFVHRMIRMEVSKAAQDAEFETFEESDDFDIEDDPLDPLTPYEAVFDPRFKRPPSEPEKPADALKQGGGGSAAPQASSQQAASPPAKPGPEELAQPAKPSSS